MANLSILIDGLPVYLCVFVRMAAIILLNPLFMRSSIPTTIKAALVMGATVLAGPLVGDYEMDTSTLGMMLTLLREFVVGYVLSFVFSAYFYLLLNAADIMDNQLGWAMAKVFDPQTNIQSGVSSKFMTIAFGLYFFVTGSHLVLIRVAAFSFTVIPPGAANLNLAAVPEFGIQIFVSVFSLALRLAVPFLAAAFIVELSMGILMKLIPQIHVFVIYMQTMIILGMIMLMVLAAVICNFIDDYLAEMFRDMQNALFAMI